MKKHNDLEFGEHDLSFIFTEIRPLQICDGLKGHVFLEIQVKIHASVIITTIPRVGIAEI